METAADINRNDVDAAMRVFEESYARLGEADPDLSHMLLMLQDDPTELMTRFEAFFDERE